MPRSGSRGHSSGGSSFGPRQTRPYSTSPPPKPQPQRPATGPAQPSAMRQIATTAAGVAAGSLLASAILGGARESMPQGVDCSEKNCRIPEDDPCAHELRAFIDCAYKAQDMNSCDGFNTLLKECRRFTEAKPQR